MKKFAIILALSSLVLLASARAQNGTSRSERARKLLLQRFDQDGDGKLSPAERQQARSALGARREAPAIPSKLSGLYGQDAPTLEITCRDLSLEDTARGRSIPFRVTYPVAAGKWPVIVWSHGMYGSQDNYQPLVELWAKHGYVVLQPSHTDSIKRGEGELPLGMAGNSKDWRSRPQDISFLLDSLSARPEIAQGKADLSKIGIGGHSFGAHTTLLLAGAQPSVGTGFAEPRARAFVAISPQGESPLFSSSSWQGLERPMLFISGDNDDSPGGQKADWRLSSFEKCPLGEKFLLWVKGAHHNFGGISGPVRRGSGPANPDQVEVVGRATLAMWDSYLKSNPQASKVLASGQLGASAMAVYHWTTR